LKKKIYIESIILILLGSFSSLSLPPFNYILINFLTFSLFYILLIKIFEVSKNKKLFFFYGWLFGLGYFTSNLYWISISLTFDESFKFLIPLSIVLVPAFLALFYGLASFLLYISSYLNFAAFYLISFSLILVSLGTASFLPTSTDVVFRIAPSNKKGFALALLSQCFAMGYFFGPFISGRILDVFGYASIIWLFISFCCFMIFLIIFRKIF